MSFTYCKTCHDRIYFRITQRGKHMPTNPDGTPHWVTCPQAKEHRKPSKKKQTESQPTLFPLPPEEVKTDD